MGKKNWVGNEGLRLRLERRGGIPKCTEVIEIEVERWRVSKDLGVALHGL